jgi:5'-deoxynucleotidase YfbR-like HD superfamily hydrolase
MNKELLNLKNSPLRNISTVIRYSGFKLLKEETVETHTMDMNVLALKMLDHLESLGVHTINRENLIYRIVIHDLEESCSCDVPRNLKYHSKEVHAAIEKATKEMVKSHVSVRLFNDMCEAKDLSILEGRIVKFLDIFQCNLILDREVNGYGNKVLCNLLKEARNFLESAILDKKLFKNDNPVITNYIEGLVTDWITYVDSQDLCS